MEKDKLPTPPPKWILKKILPPKDNETRNFTKTKDLPLWKEKMTPYDWLYELFWTEVKISPCTHIISPDDLILDEGPGYIDFFEYLRHIIG